MADDPRPHALKLHDADNVAVALCEIGGEEEVRIQGAHEGSVVAREEIPFGHKIALEPIAKGQRVIKYGESIGEATVAIEPGHHVHSHNLEGLRGRGASAQSIAS